MKDTETKLQFLSQYEAYKQLYEASNYLQERGKLGWGAQIRRRSRLP